jgi:small subunit ribosomal protein S14
MAKECIKARQVKRERIVEQYAAKRAELKKAGDYAGLAKLPRNASPVRLRNRCKITGRPRGYIRQFGLCRNMFRDWALMGKIPGVTKASW